MSDINSMCSSDEMISIQTISSEDMTTVGYEPMNRSLEPESQIGIHSLPDQYVQQLKKMSFRFNVMLVGQTGVGKSELINSLFRRYFNDASTRSHSLSRVEVITNYYDLQENYVNLLLGVIESRGFGDQIGRAESYKPIVEYIDNQFESYLKEELKIERTIGWNSGANDTRVHVCIYLIAPIGHGLTNLDLETMQALGSKVNLIPVIAKSELITKPQLEELKAKIMSEIVTNDIKIYRFPTDEPQVVQLNAENNALLPFAIVSSNEFVRINDREIRAREYPWGVIEVENSIHSDFVRLRDMILRVNMEDLRETTHTRLYEMYRSQQLEQLWEGKRSQHLLEMQRKENELIKKFTAKLKAKEVELKGLQKDLYERFEHLSKERTEENMRLDLDRKRMEEDIRTLKTRKQLLAANAIVEEQECRAKYPMSPKKRSK